MKVTREYPLQKPILFGMPNRYEASLRHYFKVAATAMMADATTSIASQSGQTKRR